MRDSYNQSLLLTQSAFLERDKQLGSNIEKVKDELSQVHAALWLEQARKEKLLELTSLPEENSLDLGSMKAEDFTEELRELDERRAKLNERLTLSIAPEFTEDALALDARRSDLHLDLEKLLEKCKKIEDAPTTEFPSSADFAKSMRQLKEECRKSRDTVRVHNHRVRQCSEEVYRRGERVEKAKEELRALESITA